MLTLEGNTFASFLGGEWRGSATNPGPLFDRNTFSSNVWGEEVRTWAQLVRPHSFRQRLPAILVHLRWGSGVLYGQSVALWAISSEQCLNFLE
jgi:hypothetical protein